MAIVTKLLACAAVLYLARAQDDDICAQANTVVTAQCEKCSDCFEGETNMNVDVGGGCMISDDCQPGGLGAEGADACDDGQDCNQLITAAITDLLEVDDPEVDDPDTDDPATVDVGGDCEVNFDCRPGGIGAPGPGNDCPGTGLDCNEMIKNAISDLLEDTGSTNPDVPEAPELCRDALEAVTARCAACEACMDGTDNAPIVEPENARLDALPESLPWAAAGPSVAVAAAVAASLVAALAGAAVMWRGRRAALASARSALVAEGHQDEDAPMVEGSSAAASAP